MGEMGLVRQLDSTRRTYSTDSRDLYFQDVARHPRFKTVEEEREYIAKGQAGDAAARDRVINANLLFVASVARKYQDRGVPFIDLINEGNIGMMHAFNKYDSTEGVKFISYADYWIRQRMQQAIANQGASVRIPLPAHGAIVMVEKRAALISQKEGIAFGEAWEKATRELGLTAHRVEHIRAARQAVSLDAPLRDGAGATLGDYLPDRRNNPAYQSEVNDLSSKVSELFQWYAQTYPRDAKRDIRILELYVGLGENSEHTFEEIGTLLNITRQRVQQLKERTIMRLRRFAQEKRLEQLIE